MTNTQTPTDHTGLYLDTPAEREEREAALANVLPAEDPSFVAVEEDLDFRNAERALDFDAMRHLRSL